MRKVCLITALLFTATFLTGQEDIRFGFQLSPTFSWMNANVSRINPSGTNLGLKLGMIGEFYFREAYALSLGLGFHFNSGGTLFHERGGEYWVNSELPANAKMFPPNVKLKYSIQYVEIPVALKMRTREFGYLRYFAQPELSFGLRTQSRGQIKGFNGVDEEEKYDIREDVNILNLSWGLGGGVEYSVSDNTALIAGLAFQSGFADVTKDKNSVYYPTDGNQTEQREENSKGTVKSIVIRLGVMF